MASPERVGFSNGKQALSGRADRIRAAAGVSRRRLSGRQSSGPRRGAYDVENHCPRHMSLVSHPPRSEVCVSLRRTRGSLFVAVVVAVAPAIVVVVVQGKQVFRAEDAWVDSMSRTKMALNLFHGGGPVLVHVPARTGDPRHSLGGFLGYEKFRSSPRCNIRSDPRFQKTIHNRDGGSRFLIGTPRHGV